MNSTFSSSRQALVSAQARAGIRSEWLFVWGTIAFVLALTALPYWYGYASTPPDKVFMGIMLDVPDHLQYFSWMRELTHAHLAANKLTPEPNAPVFFNLLWWGLGRFGSLVGWDYAQSYQFLRVTATVLFLLLVYRMCRLLLPNRLMRRTAFLVVVFGSGFGWVLVLLKYTVMQGVLLYPLDVFVAEGNTFLSILGYPHFIAAALYIFIFDLVLRGQARGDLRYAVGAGLFALFLGWQHAYDLIIVYAVLFAYALLLTLRDRRLPWYLVWSGLIVGGISCWPALYSVLLTSFDPIWRAVLAQFANAGVYTPNLLHLPILLGPAFLLALLTAFLDRPWRLRGMDDKTLFVRGWFWITFVLIYLPVDYQIHMLNGWQVPIAILATRGLFEYVAPFVERRSRRRGLAWPVQRWLVAALILAILPTNVYLWTWRFVDLGRHDSPYYLQRDEVAALAWLEKNVQPDDVVLSSLTLREYVPAITGAHAFLAHWAQTVDFYTKADMVERLFSGAMPPDEQAQVLDRFGVDYILVGAADVVGPESSLFAANSSNIVLDLPRVRIYRVP